MSKVVSGLVMVGAAMYATNKWQQAKDKQEAEEANEQNRVARTCGSPIIHSFPCELGGTVLHAIALTFLNILLAVTSFFYADVDINVLCIMCSVFFWQPPRGAGQARNDELRDHYAANPKQSARASESALGMHVAKLIVMEALVRQLRARAENVLGRATRLLPAPGEV